MVAPLLGSASYGVALGILDLLFVFGFQWGVEGAGYAAAISQYIAAFTIMAVLERRGQLSFRDLLQFPSISDALPYIKMTPSVALSSVAALAPMLASSSIATNLGADQLAAHTVLRQLSSFWLQVFMAYNATAHSMIASSLSSRNRRQGMENASCLMKRISSFALGTSIPLAIVLYIVRGYLPGIFTDNNLVNNDVLIVLPLLLVFMPLDALQLSIEGSILGAADTQWIAKRTLVSSLLSLIALAAASHSDTDLTTLWICLKLLNFAALGFDLWRFLSPSMRSRGNTRRED